MLAPADETGHGHDQADRAASTAVGQAEEASSTPEAAKAKSQVPLTCQEMAASFGMDVVPARVEALRSKAKRLVARGWLAEPAPGRFTLARGVSGSGGS